MPPSPPSAADPPADPPPFDAPDELDQYLGPPGGPGAAWCHFDAEWYLQAYPEVRAELADTGFEAVRAHYLAAGRPAGLSPNMVFDEAWYLQRHPEVAAEVAAGLLASGYEHYCLVGFITHAPHWLFDPASEAATAVSEAELAAAGCYNPYDHYLRLGARAGRNAHPLFDAATYRAGLAAAERQEAEAAGEFLHFLRRAWFARRDAVTSVYFDPAWFRAGNPGLAGEIESGRYACALHAYLSQPAATRPDPLPQFSERFYRAHNPEAEAAIAQGRAASGYEHFLRHGVFALAAPAPGIDLAGFLRAHPAAEAAIRAGTTRDAFAAWLASRAEAPPPETPPAPAPPAPAPEAAPPETAGEAAPPRAEGHGHLERFGHHAGARGWMLSGWLSPAPADPAALAATLLLPDRTLAADCVLATFPRPDLGPRGVGMLAFIAGPRGPAGTLRGLSLADATHRWTLAPLADAPPRHDAELAAALAPVIAALPEGEARSQLQQRAGRLLFTGANTLANLSGRVFLELEEVILCPPDGLTLIGWTLSAPGTLAAIRLVSGARCTPLDLARCIRYDRPDVRETVGAKHGLGADPRSGFMAHLPASYEPGAPSYLEIETRSGEIGHRPLNPPRLRGMEAIRFLADRVHVRYDEIPPAFDHVLGPSIASLNADRLHSRPTVREIAFGTPPAAPDLSVIVTLYGRVDFMEYQLGLLSAHTPAIAIEYLYVLDDPALVWQAETLCASLFARFRIPLTLFVLDRNMGYAPANNIALAAARAPHVCFMNSDVFPDTPDWAERLRARLAADPGLGAVGPLLLFEDGSVQHQGMHFERIPAMGNLHFPLHDRKGWKPPDATGLLPVPAATAACLMLATDRARGLGGIDEAYLIGDFEDADLCLRLRQRGLACAVDLDTRMFHLERQSQAGPENRWRVNVTLFNAWLHERRWAATLAAEPPA